MLKQFAYNAAGLEASAIDIVEGALSLARQTYEGKKDADYNSKNAFICGQMALYALEGSRFASRLDGITDEAAKNEAARKLFEEPMVNTNTGIRSNFDLILSQVITAINPEVSNEIFSGLIAETRQIGYGDTAVFQLESNDLFAVKEIAEGVRRGVDQPMWDDEVTVHPTPATIDTHIDWYPFAAGRFDMGYFAVKIAKSFAAYIFAKTVKGLTAATTAFGAAYSANGVSVQNWGTLRQRVQAANGGMKVIAVGTPIALSNCAITGNYQVAIGDEMTKVGYISTYLQTPLMAIDNVMVPGTVNSTGQLLLPDDRIYMIPVAGDKPVKIVFEGNQTTVTDNPEDCSDLRYGVHVKIRVGVACVAGSKFGTIIL